MNFTRKFEIVRLILKSCFAGILSSILLLPTMASATSKTNGCSYCEEQENLKKRFLEVNQEKAKEINKGFVVLEKMLSEFSGKKSQIDEIVEWIGTLLEEGDELYISAEKAFGTYSAHKSDFQKSIEAQPPFLKERLKKAFSTVAKVKKHGNG